jgi:hypothetical protein
MGSASTPAWSSGYGESRPIDGFLRRAPIMIEKPGHWIVFAKSKRMPFSSLDELANIGMPEARVFFTDLLYPEDRAWMLHIFSLPEAQFGPRGGIPVRMDGDPDQTPYNIPPYNNQVDVLPGVASWYLFPAVGPNVRYVWILMFPESFWEMHRSFYPGVAPGAAYAPMGISRFDTLRARVLAHEIMHTLSKGVPGGGPFPPRTAPATYPAALLLRQMHSVPGITRPMGDAVLDPVATPGATMQSGSNLNAGPAESDLSPYMIWRSRSTLIAPYWFR